MRAADREQSTVWTPTVSAGAAVRGQLLLLGAQALRRRRRAAGRLRAGRRRAAAGARAAAARAAVLAARAATRLHVKLSTRALSLVSVQHLTETDVKAGENPASESLQRDR